MPRNLSREELEEVWLFHPDGSLTWNKGRKQVKAGDRAGCTNLQGYSVLTYGGYQYKIHRLVYAYHTGEWPRLIDHKNGDRSDNRIENLRSATHEMNTLNTNKSYGKIPYRGVSHQKGRFRSYVQVNGNREFLGYFDSPELARDAYVKRRSELADFVIGG